MLADQNAMATIAVKDVPRARRFYGDTLGLKFIGGAPGEVVILKSGNSQLVVYRSEFSGSNKATSVTWGVGDSFDAIVAHLKAAGVTFEHYELPGLTREGDVHRQGEFKAAWFKDPDGNILHINNM